MVRVRGKYASPVQVERRERILDETLKLLGSVAPQDIIMDQIAEASGVSTKTLYNLFQSRNGLLLAAGARTREGNESYGEVLSARAGIPRIIALTQRAMDTFGESPAFMESAVSLVLGITAEEEAEYQRVGRTQEWFYEQLLVAKSEGDLLPTTDCLQLSQLMAASQWGCTLLWQKKLISLEELRGQTLLKHCLDLKSYCVPARQAWLKEIESSVTANQDTGSSAGSTERTSAAA
ncbi:MAG: TetR/AcrR family transcriptional regulator [Halieaceae bacterium]